MRKTKQVLVGRIAGRSDGSPIGQLIVRVTVRSDGGPVERSFEWIVSFFRKDVFVYDGLTFEVFVVAFENIEVSATFRSVARTVVRSAGNSIGRALQ